LKESNYEGRKVNITINGWGNKIANDLMLVLIPTPMTLFGQSLWRRHQKEVHDQYIMTLMVNYKEKINSDGTDIETDYTYNSFNQLNETSKKKIKWC
jgi:hypothetical protein